MKCQIFTVLSIKSSQMHTTPGQQVIQTITLEQSSGPPTRQRASLPEPRPISPSTPSPPPGKGEGLSRHSFSVCQHTGPATQASALEGRWTQTTVSPEASDPGAALGQGPVSSKHPRGCCYFWRRGPALRTTAPGRPLLRGARGPGEGRAHPPSPRGRGKGRAVALCPQAKGPPPSESPPSGAT